jgi:hypothetical protein
MKVSDLEDIVSVVSKEFFEYKFINYFNKLAEEQLND